MCTARKDDHCRSLRRDMAACNCQLMDIYDTATWYQHSLSPRLLHIRRVRKIVVKGARDDEISSKSLHSLIYTCDGFGEFIGAMVYIITARRHVVVTRGFSRCKRPFYLFIYGRYRAEYGAGVDSRARFLWIRVTSRLSNLRHHIGRTREIQLWHYIRNILEVVRGVSVIE